MRINCSNCCTSINLNVEAGTVSHTTKAHGRAGKRVEAATITNDVWTDGYLLMWDAPCCTVGGDAYADSYEVGA